MVGIFHNEFFFEIFQELQIDFIIIAKLFSVWHQCESFFSKYCDDYTNEDRISLLFRFIQYIERQVVLFDAIEDASFKEINNLDGVGTLRNMKEEFETNDSKEELHKYLSSVSVRPVLTAHPTQFYPGSVLGIITDLSKAIKDNDLKNIKDLLFSNMNK